MIIVLISLVIVVLSFNFFMISYQVNGVNRLVLAMPISLYETAMDMYEIDENQGPRFDKKQLEKNIHTYFDYSMGNYTTDYKVSFYYFNPINHSICLTDRCSAVEVKVEANLFMNFHYKKTMYYQIRSN